MSINEQLAHTSNLITHNEGAEQWHDGGNATADAKRRVHGGARCGGDDTALWLHRSTIREKHDQSEARSETITIRVKHDLSEA